jgi:hypothetical protein
VGILEALQTLFLIKKTYFLAQQIFPLRPREGYIRLTWGEFQGQRGLSCPLQALCSPVTTLFYFHLFSLNLVFKNITCRGFARGIKQPELAS